jgi:hypothetical protein
VARIYDALREPARLRAGRSPTPTSAIVDSQSVLAAGSVARASRGFDGGKSLRHQSRPSPGRHQLGPDTMSVPAGPATQDQRKEMAMEAGQGLPPSTPSEHGDLPALLRAARKAAGTAWPARPP